MKNYKLSTFMSQLQIFIKSWNISAAPENRSRFSTLQQFIEWLMFFFVNIVNAIVFAAIQREVYTLCQMDFYPHFLTLG